MVEPDFHHLNESYDHFIPFEELIQADWKAVGTVLGSLLSVGLLYSGYSLVEAGRACALSMSPILAKNLVALAFSGLAFWALGYGFAYSDSVPNAFIGMGLYFFFDFFDDYEAAVSFPRFFYLLGFAMVTSLIVSTCLARRVRFLPAVVVTTIVTLLHCVTAHWIWISVGFLAQMRAIDLAGASVVHLVAGTASLTVLLYFRLRKHAVGLNEIGHEVSMSKTLSGVCLIWIALFFYNIGPLYNKFHEQGDWYLVARSAITTVVAAFAGGCVGVIWSFVRFRGFHIDQFVDGLLGATVATAAPCFSIKTCWAVPIGAIGGSLACGTGWVLPYVGVDDPVGIVRWHFLPSVWSLWSCGIFASNVSTQRTPTGLAYSGGFLLLGVQNVAIFAVLVWTASITLLTMKIMALVHIRLTPDKNNLDAVLEQPVMPPPSSTALFKISPNYLLPAQLPERRKQVLPSINDS